MIKRTYQSGMMLLEALIGILIFSIGILALVAMQAAAIGSVADAQVNLSNQVLANIWTTVDRSSDAAFTASLLTFDHRSAGAPDTCDFQGQESTAAGVQSWYNMIRTGTGDGSGSSPLLPGGNNPAYQQIQVDTGTNNRITVTICWLPPNAAPGAAPNRHSTVGYIN
jgi:type IV pilus assembly protein PilV